MSHRSFLLLLALLAMPSQAASAPAAQSRVRAGLEAMGGEARWRAMTSVKLSGRGHWYHIEQSERPEGPYVVSYEQVDEVRDLARGRLRQTATGFSPVLPPEGFTSSLLLADGAVAMERGGQWAPMRAAQLQDFELRLLTAPERVLLHALDAADLARLPDTVLQGVPHHVVRFTHGTTEVRIYLNQHTRLPTAVDALDAHPADVMWSVWGDVLIRTYLQGWTLEPGGLLYPHHWQEERSGVPYHLFTVSTVGFDVPLEEAALTLPDEVRKAYAARAQQTADTLPLGGRKGEGPAELAPGVVQLPGLWNVALVRQDDGLVVLEAPISSGYSARVLEEAQRRFPGARVSAAVSTSDAWPHVGGVREYVARGVPLYALDLNRPLLERLLAAPRTRTPDALARAPRRAVLRSISRRLTVGRGENRVELIPLRTEAGERMVLAWLPGPRLLYTSDVVQPQSDGGFFNPVQLQELVQVVAREGLQPEAIFGMHVGLTPWTRITEALAKATAVAQH